MKAFQLMLILAIGVTGCAARPAPLAASNAQPVIANNAGLQCHMEKLTGSMIATRVCTTAQQRADMERKAQDLRRAINSMQGTSCKAAAGGC